MHSEKGSATVPVALFGVSPNRWCGRFDAPYGAPRRMLPARRRDADESGRDDRAPQLQLHRSGLLGDRGVPRDDDQKLNQGESPLEGTFLRDLTIRVPHTPYCFTRAT